MKKLMLLGLALTVTVPSAFAETRYCADETQQVQATISENYIGGKILIRRLHKISVNGETIYRSFLGKMDNGSDEPIELSSDLAVYMYSGGINVLTPEWTAKLDCQ